MFFNNHLTWTAITVTTPATKRYVFNFTLRDEREDTINVSVWGSVDYVVPISELCYIGAYGITVYDVLGSFKKLISIFCVSGFQLKCAILEFVISC